MDNGDRKLLREVHGSVSRIEGALPYLATKAGVVTAITSHATACARSRAVQRPSQAPAKKALTNAKTKLYIAAAGLLTSAAGLIIWWVATN